MKQYQNTLFVTTQGAYLAREGACILVRVEKETKLRIPVHTIGGIVCFGRVSCSPPALDLCAGAQVSVSFLSQNGRFIASLRGREPGNVLLRREQYRLADHPEATASMARAIVAAKVANSKTVLQRATRDHPDSLGTAEVDAASNRLHNLLEQLRETQSLERVRGIEGDAARIYFHVFDHLITAQKESFFFRSRNRRPPLDNVNCLLSFIYALLTNDATSALQTVGLDPCVGFLHRDRPGRPGLALDIMEEFRAFLADRLVLSLVNLQQVQPGGFIQSESGAVRMSDATRKEVLIAYQKRKQEEIQHPFLGETVTVGLLLHMQALLLARHLRGDLDGYPPFFWK